jgi:hypothetical protein
MEARVRYLAINHEEEQPSALWHGADLVIKERALARTTPAENRPGRFRPADKLLAFLEAL